MPNIDELLTRVEDLVRHVRLSEAEQEIRSLLATLGNAELKDWEVDLRRTIDEFLPKRRKILLEVLDERLARNDDSIASGTAVGAHAEVSELIEPFEDALRDLSERHIFGWSTFYRDTLSTFFEQFLNACWASQELERIDLKPVMSALSVHSEEIFSKGYSHQTKQRSESENRAIAKSLNGLQRFLDLPLEFYSTRIPRAHDSVAVRSLRELCSTMSAGIINGFAALSFDSVSGSKVLETTPRAWVYALPFVTRAHLTSLLSSFDTSDLRDGLSGSVVPLAGVIDQLTSGTGDYAPLPVLAELAWDVQRLEISLEPPPHIADPQPLEVHCYLDPLLVTRLSLQEAVRRNVVAVLAPLRPDLSALIQGDEHLREVVIDCERAPDAASRIQRRALSVLEHAIYKRRSARLGNQALAYNFAREFPLHNPFLTRYFHVYRSSVRDLLRTFERRNGVRLWCSLRRSGKTTSCQDMGSSTGDSVVVTQTCASTGNLPEGTVFYRAVCDALESGRQLPATFLADRVAESAVEQNADPGARFGFVLDEYETLFGRLRGATRRDEGLRYSVVQPLLDQMVEFAEANLVVFLGQQPNAHFILMDQNQLSAYVEQDPFPLFRHDHSVGGAEFSELIRKVFVERATFDDTFARALFEETAGHPYLTVNVLVELVDWLIETRRPISDLSLTDDDFYRFSESWLTRKRIGLSPEFTFFREAVGEAISDDGRSQAPWLFAVYSSLREIGRSSPNDLAVSSAEFEDLVDHLRLPELGFSAESILSTAGQANFLHEVDGQVGARIRLLGRIAAASKPRVGP